MSLHVEIESLEPDLKILFSRKKSIALDLQLVLEQLQLWERHREPEEEQSELVEGHADSNTVYIKELKLSSKPVKKFYVLCHKEVQKIQQNIKRITDIFEAFSADSVNELPGLVVRTIFALRLLILSSEEFNSSLLAKINSAIHECFEATDEAFRTMSEFGSKLDPEIIRLELIIDYVQCSDIIFEEKLDFNNNLIKQICSLPDDENNNQDQVQTTEQLYKKLMKFQDKSYSKSTHLSSISSTRLSFTALPSDCSIVFYKTGQRNEEPIHINFSKLTSDTKYSLILILLENLKDSMNEVSNKFTMFKGKKPVNFEHLEDYVAKKVLRNPKTVNKLLEFEKFIIANSFQRIHDNICETLEHLDTLSSLLELFACLMNFANAWIRGSLVQKKLNGEIEDSEVNEDDLDFKDVEALQRLKSLKEAAQLFLKMDLREFEPSCPQLSSRISELLMKDIIPPRNQYNSIETTTTTTRNIQQRRGGFYLEKIFEKGYKVQEIQDLNSRKPTFPLKLDQLNTNDYHVYLEKFVEEFDQKIGETFLESLDIALTPKVSESSQVDGIIGFFEGISFVIYSFSWRLKERISLHGLILLQSKFSKLVQNLIRLKKMEKKISQSVAAKIYNGTLKAMLKRCKLQLKTLYCDKAEELQDSLDSICDPIKDGFHLYDRRDCQKQQSGNDNFTRQLEIFWKVCPEGIGNLHFRVSEGTVNHQDGGGLLLTSSIESAAQDLHTFDSCTSQTKVELLLCILDSAIAKSEDIVKSLLLIKPQMKDITKQLISLDRCVKQLERRRQKFIRPHETYTILKALQINMNSVLAQWKQMSGIIQRSLFLIHNSFLEIFGPGVGRETTSQRNPFYYISNIHVIVTDLTYNLEEDVFERLKLDVSNPLQLAITDYEDPDEGNIKAVLGELGQDDKLVTKQQMKRSSKLEKLVTKSCGQLIKKYMLHVKPTSTLPRGIPKLNDYLQEFEIESIKLTQLLESNLAMLKHQINSPSASLRSELNGPFSTSLAISHLLGLAIMETPKLSVFHGRTKQEFTFLHYIQSVTQVVDEFQLTYHKIIRPAVEKLETSLFEFTKVINTAKSQDPINIRQEQEGESSNLDTSSSDSSSSDSSALSLARKHNMLIGWLNNNTGLFIQNLVTEKVTVFETLEEGKKKLVLVHLLKLLKLRMSSSFLETTIEPTLKQFQNLIISNRKNLCSKELLRWKFEAGEDALKRQQQQLNSVSSTLEFLTLKYNHAKLTLEQIWNFNEKIVKCLRIIEDYAKIKISSEMGIWSGKLELQETLYEKKLEVIERTLVRLVQEDSVAVSLELSL